MVAVSAVGGHTIVLATLQQLAPGVAVAAAVPAAGSFTITLTATPSASVTVGWFAIG